MITQKFVTVFFCQILINGNLKGQWNKDQNFMEKIITLDTNESHYWI